MNSMLSRKREYLSWRRLIQVTISILLLWIVIKDFRVESFRAIVERINLWTLFLAILLVSISHVANVRRWYFLVNNNSISFSDLLVIYGTGLFGNNFLPTGFGGDVARASLLSQHINLKGAILSVTLDRILGFAGLAAILMLGIWLGYPANLDLFEYSISLIVRDVILFVLAGVIIIALGLLLFNKIKGFHGEDARIFSKRIDWTKAVGTIFDNQSVSGITWAFFLSILSHFIIVSAYWMILKSLGLDNIFTPALWLYLIGFVSMLLPLTFNGVGLQEGLFLLAIKSYGFSEILGLYFALIARLVIIGFGVAGGLVSIIWNPIRVGHQTNTVDGVLK
jgi:uncharacterized protein (TIRG00374 family)